MLRCILLMTFALALPAFAQTGEPAIAALAATDTPPASEGTPAVDPTPAPDAAPAPVATPEMTPEQKLTQFRHDKINLLALRGDAGSLLAAALMAGADAGDKSRPVALKSPALLKRAQAAGADSAMVWWATYASECAVGAKGCSNPEALQRLESLDPENAAVWLLSVARAQQAKDGPAARAALASAAQAKRYSDYFGALIATVYQAQDVLPMSADLLRASTMDARVEGYRLIYAANVVASRLTPQYAPLLEACKPPNPPDPALVDDCIAIAKKMEGSGTLVAQRIGLRLQDSLLAAGPELDAAHARERSLAWQTQHMGELAGLLANDDHVTRIYTNALAESGDESAGVLAVLGSQHVSLKPPADWQPFHSDTTPQP